MLKKTLALLLVLAMLVGFSGNMAFTVSAADADSVAAIGEVGYPTVNAAIEAAADGDEIDLLTDVSEMIVINKKDITLDLNGNTVTGRIYVCRGEGAYNSSALNAVIKNGSVVAAADTVTAAVYVHNTSATLQDLTITSAYGDAVNSSGNTTIEGKTTITATNGYGIRVQYNLTINGDEVAVTGKTNAIWKAGNWTGVDAVVINGGTYTYTENTGNTYAALYVDSGANPATIDINGGNFSGPGAYTARFRNGIVTVDDATFTGHLNVSPNAPVVDLTINSGSIGALSCFTSADAVAGMETFSIVVNGGEINGQNLANLEGLEMPEGKTGLVINGGTFTFDVTKYGKLGEGKTIAQNAEGKWVVAAPVASIGTAGYGSVTAAIAAANEGDTIVLNQDVAEMVNINKKGITLDLNGKTVTGQVQVSRGTTHGNVFVKNGTVTGGSPSVYVYNTDATLQDLTITAEGKALNVSGATTIEGKTTITSTGDVGLYAQHAFTINGNDVSITGAKYAIQKNSNWTGVDVLTINGGTFTGTDAALYVDGGDTPVTVDINGGTFVGAGSYSARFRNGIVTVDNATFTKHFNIQPNTAVMDVTINSGSFGALSCFTSAAQVEDMETMSIVVNGGEILGQNLANLEGLDVLTINGGTWSFDPTAYGTVAADKHCMPVTGDEVTTYVVGDHAFDQEVATEEFLADAATATYYYSCACGAKGTETFEYGTNAVALINGIPYNSVAEAVAAAAQGDEIILKKDVSDMIELNKKGITLNLNGKTVTGQIKVCRGDSHGDVVVKNGSVVGNGTDPAVYVYNTNATLQDLTVTNAGTAVNSSGVTTIEGKTTITSTAGVGLYIQFNAIINGEDVSITGATYAVQKNSNWTGVDVLTINGGTFTGTDAALYVDGGANPVTVDINGGTFVGAGSYTAVFRNGVVTVDNASFSSHFNVNPNAAIVDVTINSGSLGALSCFVSADRAASMETFSIVVNGGEINGQNLANLEDLDVLTINGGTWSFDPAKYGKVAEGKHVAPVVTDEVTTYVVGDHAFDQEAIAPEFLATSATPEKPATYYYSCVCGAKGTETFEYGSIGVASINGVAYGSLSAAVEAAVAGDTVVLGADVTEMVTVDKSITVDLGGNTVTGRIYVKRDADGKAIDATICNGSVVATAETETAAVYVYNTAATLRDLTITSEYGNALNASGITTIEGNTTITSTVADGIYAQYAFIIKGSDVSVTGARYGIYKGASWTGNDTCSIEGGTFVGGTKPALYWEALGNITITDGVFTTDDTYVAHFRYGNVTIENGDFTNYVLFQATRDASADKNGNFTTNNLVAVINGGIYDYINIYATAADFEANEKQGNIDEFSVTINDATVEKGMNIKDLFIPEDRGGFVVKGGTFALSLTKYCLTGHTAPVTTVEGEGEEAVETTVYVYTDEECVFDQQVATHALAVTEPACTATEFYVSCVCGFAGEETFTAEPVGHSFKETDFVDCVTPIECRVCKEVVAPGHVEVVVPGTMPTCTTTGMSDGVYCSVCEEVLEEAIELPVLEHDYTYSNVTDETHDKVCSVGGESVTEEHTYTDGFCVCGAEEPAQGPVPTPSLKFVGNYLSFQEYIGMQTMLQTKLVKDYTKVYVKATQTPVGGVASEPITLNPIDLTSSYKVFDMKVMAWDMTDTITMTLYAEDANGVVYEGQTVTATVEALALEKLAQLDGTNEAGCRVLVDMLNYGAAVQTAYDHNASSLPNTNLGEFAKYATTGDITIGGEVTSTGTATGLTDGGIYVSMQAQVELTMLIKPKTGYSIENMEMRVTPEGGETRIFDHTTFKMNGAYYVPTIALKAADFRTPHTLAIYDKTTGAVLSKVHLATVEAKAAAYLAVEQYKPVVENMMKYGDAVAAMVAGQ